MTIPDGMLSSVRP